MRAARTDRVELLAALIVVGAALAFVVDHVAHDDVYYVMWADRDMVRSDVPFGALPASGPELWLGWGARIPGGGLHVLWWLALRVFGAHPSSVLLAQWILMCAGAAALAVAARRWLGVLPAALAFALAVTSTPAVTTLQTLWNPGFTIGLGLLAVAATVAGLSGRDPRWAGATALVVAAALQTHLSAGLLGVGLAGAWLLAGPVRTVRWGLAGLGVSLLGWVSYVREEAATGWENTRLLFAPEQLATLAPATETSAHRFGEAGRVLDLLFGGCAFWWSPDAWWGALSALAAVLLWVPLDRAAATSPEVRRLGRVGLGLVALVVLAYMRSSADAGEREAARYLVAVAGAVPLWAAASLAATVGWPRRVWGAVLVSLALAITAAQHENLRTERRVASPAHLRHLESWTAELRARTGWSLAEVTGRTVAVQRTGGSDWRRILSVGMAWQLEREGEAFPGSLAPPCAVYVDHDVSITPDAWATPEVLSRAIGYPAVARIDTMWVGEQRSIVLYTPTTDRCPTTFGARYLLTPEEVLTHDPVGAPPIGGAVVIARGDADMVRYRLTLPLAAGVDTPIPALLTVRRTGPDAVEATLHANALRGRGWNYGFFENAALTAPALVSRDAAGAELGRLAFTTGVAGGRGALTPLTVAGTLPEGRWTFEAVSDRSSLTEVAAFDPADAVQVSIPLPR